MSSMLPVPNDPRSLKWIPALDVHHHPCAAPDGEVVIKVPLLIATSVGTEYDESGTMATLRDVHNETETRKSC